MQAPDVSSSFGRIFHILAWIVLVVVLFWFFQDYLAKQQNPKQQLQSSYSKTRSLAEQNPLATAGIAFVAGMLVTTLLRRR